MYSKRARLSPAKAPRPFLAFRLHRRKTRGEQRRRCYLFYRQHARSLHGETTNEDASDISGRGPIDGATS